MYSTKPIVKISALLLCLCCSACLAMQQQIDDNSRDLDTIRNQLSRTHNDVEQLRGEIQALSGTMEENSVVHSREINDMKTRLDNLTARLTNPSSDTIAIQAPSAADTEAAPVDAAQEHYDRALKLYYDRDYERSRLSFQTFLKQYRSSPLSQNAFFWIGMSLFQQKDYRDSISTLEDLIKEFPQGSKVPDAYYWQALSFIELREMLTAQILLETLMQTYPSAEASKKAQAKYQELKFDTSR